MPRCAERDAQHAARADRVDRQELREARVLDRVRREDGLPGRGTPARRCRGENASSGDWHLLALEVARDARLGPAPPACRAPGSRAPRPASSTTWSTMISSRRSRWSSLLSACATRWRRRSRSSFSSPREVRLGSRTIVSRPGVRVGRRGLLEPDARACPTPTTSPALSAARSTRWPLSACRSGSRGRPGRTGCRGARPGSGWRDARRSSTGMSFCARAPDDDRVLVEVEDGPALVLVEDEAGHAAPPGRGGRHGPPRPARCDAGGSLPHRASPHGRDPGRRRHDGPPHGIRATSAARTVPRPDGRGVPSSRRVPAAWRKTYTLEELAGLAGVPASRRRGLGGRRAGSARSRATATGDARLRLRAGASARRRSAAATTRAAHLRRQPEGRRREDDDRLHARGGVRRPRAGACSPSTSTRRRTSRRRSATTPTRSTLTSENLLDGRGRRRRGRDPRDRRSRACTSIPADIKLCSVDVEDPRRCSCASTSSRNKLRAPLRPLPRDPVRLPAQPLEASRSTR